MRAILFVLAAIGSIATAHAAGLEGYWAGTWTKAGDALSVTVDFSKANNAYAGTFDSDALQVAAIPFAQVTVTGDNVRFTLRGDATTTSFDGKLSGDTISGAFSEGAVKGAFTLARAAPPPAFDAREVTFTNGPVTLAGELLRPTTPGRHPAIIFLHGSGGEGRWAARYLARKFASQGFVALIYDKRGVGASKGDWHTSDFEDLAGDAAAGLRLLATEPSVDPARLGVYGHSQGGYIAPLAAVRHGNVAFVIASAASGLPPAECEIYSIENAIGVRDLPPAEQADARLFVKTIVDVGYRGAPRADLDEVVKRFRGRAWFFEPPAPDDRYWTFSRRTASYRVLDFWRQVRAPVFLPYGERDERVPPRISADAISAALKAAGNNRVAVKIYPNAGHAFHIEPQSPPGGWRKRIPGYADDLIGWAQAPR
jgi:alpha-beta hydrolase superfamily lysophospholipase